MATKEELRTKLDELGVEQPSADAKKEELEEAVASAEGSSDAEKEDLSPSGQEALEEMGEDSEAAKEADLALDASGPLHLESPSVREMTGAVSEEHAKEQEELLKDKPEDYVGSVSEAGFDEDGNPAAGSAEPKGQPKDNLSENDERDPEDVYEVRQEDVIDFPPPVGEREGESGKGDETAEGAAGGAFHTEALGSASTPGARSRLFEQKAVFYTDGLSGEADHNHERAYATPEILQSSDPVVREAGDVSESEAFKATKSDKDEERAEEAKQENEEDDNN